MLTFVLHLFSSYRIHLSPGSRRSSARSAASKAMNGKKANNTSPIASTESSAPPPLSPPPLETARIYSHHSTPPDSPPPLAQATLPATASIPLDSYNYRSGTTTYQEQSQAPGYTYVHTTPINQPPSGSSNGNSLSSYSNSHDNFNVSPIQQNQNDHRDNSPVSISSRHSISHISHPQSSYQSSSASPPSPASSQSHQSAPATPTYSVFHDDSHPYHHHHHHHHHQHSNHGNGMINNDHPQSHILSQQNGNHYHSNGHSTGRFNSPPPTLAPIQGERLIRRPDDSRHSQNHHTSPYIHTQAVGDYPYHQGMGLGHGAWKAESGMRKGLGAALV
jgi:zinc-finger protein CreA/MIG